MKSKVTVAIPVYNDEKYLREAIDSILNQTYKDFILLIINDGSTDNSEDIIASYTDKRIKLINHSCNMGRPAARNTALDAADTEYLAWMDADDISLPDRLQKQIAFLDSHPKISVCGSRVRYFHEMRGTPHQESWQPRFFTLPSPTLALSCVFHPSGRKISPMIRGSNVQKTFLFGQISFLCTVLTALLFLTYSLSIESFYDQQIQNGILKSSKIKSCQLFI